MSLSQYGTAVPENDSVCYVSYWHIPGGCDYVNAIVMKRYFSDKEFAEKLADKYSYPPQMAFVVDISHEHAIN